MKTNRKVLKDSMQMDRKLEGSKQRILVVPGQNIAFCSKERLIRMLATEKWGIHFNDLTLPKSKVNDYIALHNVDDAENHNDYPMEVMTEFVLNGTTRLEWSFREIAAQHGKTLRITRFVSVLMSLIRQQYTTGLSEEFSKPMKEVMSSTRRDKLL